MIRTFASLTEPERDRWLRLSDGLAAALVASLPWSTSATEILLGAWLVVTLPTLTPNDLRDVLRRPAGALPVLLCLMGLIGMLWASDATWAERLGGFNSFPRLLVIPLLMAHFLRSGRAIWCVAAFFASCAVLLVASGFYAFAPALRASVEVPGVPVKDYIAQSQFFQLCAFGLLYPVFDRGVATRWKIVCGLLALLFLADIAYVVSSRTALILTPLLVLLFGWRRFGWRGLAAGCLAAVLLGGVVWASSPYMREKLEALFTEAQRDRLDAVQTSTGQRIEFYRKSLAFVWQAPVIGHGTGAIKPLFRQAAAGSTGAAGVAASNPHQQTLAVAIQLGLVGAALLWAMWAAHTWLFVRPGLIAWLGIALVAQNVLSSLFNSHLFDFAQGWLYVLGAGICGGAVLHEAARRAKGSPPG